MGRIGGQILNLKFNQWRISYTYKAKLMFE